MDGGSLPLYLALVAFILFSGYFAASETAFASMNRIRVKSLADDGNKKAKRALRIADQFDKMLTTVLIGNNLMHIGCASLATLLATRLWGDGAVATTTLVTTIVLFLVAETLPKSYAKANPEKVAMAFAPSLGLLMKLLTPLDLIFGTISKLVEKLAGGEEQPTVTEEEFQEILDTIEEEGTIEEETTELLQSALDFSETTAQEILVPRVDMLAIDIEDSYDEIVKTALDAPFSRIPVYEGSIDNIIGVLHVNHLLRDLTLGEKVNIRSLLLPPLFIHKTMRLNTIMDELRAHKMHIAVVVDEYGGTMGMVTMEDVLEELVGDIWDERDVIENEFSDNADGTVDVDGDVSISELLERFDLDDKDVDSDYVTLGGWAIEMLGGYPQVGDSFRFKNLVVTVAEMEDLRITLLRVKAEPVSEETEE